MSLKGAGTNVNLLADLGTQQLGFDSKARVYGSTVKGFRV